VLQPKKILPELPRHKLALLLLHFEGGRVCNQSRTRTIKLPVLQAVRTEIAERSRTAAIRCTRNCSCTGIGYCFLAVRVAWYRRSLRGGVCASAASHYRQTVATGISYRVVHNPPTPDVARPDRTYRYFPWFSIIAPEAGNRESGLLEC
jgi:hypothetical protein